MISRNFDFLSRRLMKKIEIKSLLLVIFMFVSYSCYIWLRIEHSLRIHEPRMSFGDTPDYLKVASERLLSQEFWLAIRPPTVPLFFKLFNSDPERIFAAQVWLSILAWGIFALVVVLALQTYLLKPVAFLLILAFSLGQNIIIWDPLILSDSLAISFLALFLASCIWLAIERKPYKYLLLTVTTLLLVFVRDTFAYFILMAGVGLLLIALFANNYSSRKQMVLVSGFFIAIFIISSVSVTAGRRWQLPFLTTLGLRILPNREYVAYFEARGMPVNDALMERSGKTGYADNFAFLNDPRLDEFRSWVEKHGQSEYIRFLWFFKADTLQTPLNDLSRIFNPDVYYYAGTGYRPIITDARLSELLYPVRFGILSVLIAHLLAAALIFPAVHYRNLLFAIPIMLVLLSYPQAVLIWSADANDIARHSVYHNIELRLGLWLMVLFVADFIFIQVINNRIKNDTQSKNSSNHRASQSE